MQSKGHCVENNIIFRVVTLIIVCFPGFFTFHMWQMP
jgi:hypothetical protein